MSPNRVTKHQLEHMLDRFIELSPGTISKRLAYEQKRDPYAIFAHNDLVMFAVAVAVAVPVSMLVLSGLVPNFLDMMSPYVLSVVGALGVAGGSMVGAALLKDGEGRPYTAAPFHDVAGMRARIELQEYVEVPFLREYVDRVHQIGRPLTYGEGLIIRMYLTVVREERLKNMTQ